MNDEKILELIEKFGVDGFQAFYVYLTIDYISFWVLIGLIVWGVRTIWNHIKENI